MSPDGEERARPVALPTGTVTFLFSDIEGSTQRWELHPEAMQAAVARHEQLVTGAIARHGGSVFKIMGDAVCAAFPTAPSALRAAAEAQTVLVNEDFSSVDGLRVRMGLHTGHAEERNADYFGPAVNRVARLMSIGHGSQILLSGITRDLALRDLPAGASFLDLGPQRLKDLTEAEQVWQLTIEGGPSEFPPLKSLDTLPNNLPVQVTSFRGREQNLEELKLQLAEHRLITLFGAGGVGKTRLAVQVGADLLDRFPDGVWIADLAPIMDPELVASVIARAVGMRQAGTRRVEESLSQWLKRKQLLLILDNCEQILETAANLADAIHRNCPSVRILATSRQALGVSGEKVWRLASLAVPDKNEGLTPTAAIQYGAIALFADRASLVDQSFQLSDTNVAIIADICRRLDGIPLAIELAAARVRVLSLPNLAQRLNERFKILTSGSRTALPRQKTLSALIEWSYDLLSPQEQTLFNRLAIFAGRFTLDAATCVCAGNDIGEKSVLDLVASLADKSLIVADTSADQERYRLLESTREYALEKLIASGDRERLAGRHAAYFLGVAQNADQSLGAMPLDEWLGKLEPDVENFRAVLEWALGKAHDATLGGTVAGALEMFWWHGGGEVEGRRWIEIALNQIDEGEQPDVAVRLRQALAVLTSRVLYS